MLIKKICSVAMTCLLISTAAHSREITNADIEMCEMWAKLAEVIMKARQLGAPMKLKPMPVGDEAWRVADVRTQNAIIQAAYSVPRMATDEFIAKEIVDFRNAIYLNCTTSASGGK